MGAAVINASWVGRQVDEKFMLLEWLGGSGGSGVFRTELREGPRAQNAAIKLILAEGIEADARLAAWADAVKLSHPHVMPVYRSGRWRADGEALIYVVTEFADEVLSKVLPERPIAPSEAREMLLPVIDALGYLHRNRMVHGHIKPSNILVVDNRLKVSGDGLHMANRYRKTAAELDVYDGPELAQAPVSPASDVWSLGVTLVEALTRALPEVVTGGNEDPRLPDGLPQPFAGIARECLRRNSTRRLTLAEIEARLGAAEGTESPEDEEEAGAPPKKTWLVLALGTVLIALIVAAVVMMRGHHGTGPVQAPATSNAPAATGGPATSPSADSAASPNVPSAAPSGSSAPASSPTPTASSAAPSAAKGGSASSAPATPSASKPSPAQPTPLRPAPVNDSPSTGTANGEVAQQFLPTIPASASRTIQGKVDVVVRAAVDGAGNVTAATLATPGPSKYFANQALESAKNWKFKPEAVGSVWLLHFEFRQSGPEATATQLTR